jgi:hypothetical protein
MQMSSLSGFAPPVLNGFGSWSEIKKDSLA